MLKPLKLAPFKPVLNKEMWVKMLEAAGMSEEEMGVWHAEFEKRAPDAHYEFLLSIGIPKKEAQEIQAWSREAGVAE